MFLFQTTQVVNIAGGTDVNIRTSAGNPKDPRNVIVNLTANATASTTGNQAVRTGTGWTGGTTVLFRNLATITGLLAANGVGGAGGTGGRGNSGGITPGTAGSAGGTGPTGGAALGIDAVTNLNLLIDLNLDLHVNVVIGQQHQQKKNIEQLCVQHNFICHIQTDQMASLMGSADLAIGAGGASNWERCCMGLPTIVVSTAANQISISSELSKFGGCVYVGSAGSNTLEKIQKALLSFINSPKDIENCSRIGLDLVDGDGASRVCKKLINQMRVEVLISNKDHPVTRHVRNWALNQRNIHIVHSTKDLQGGHILFLVSCNEILQTDTIKKFKHTLILHASDLPEGRGWSPHIWSVLEGKKTITLSLLEADTKVDQGSIWLKENIELENPPIMGDQTNSAKTKIIKMKGNLKLFKCLV